MKLNKIFAVGAIVALTLGLASCSKKQDAPDNDGKQVTDTYVGLTIKFPTPIPNPVGPRALSDDYNKIGEWEGRDEIKTITVYVVTDAATINSTTFNESAFTGISGGVLNPNLAVEAKAGQQVKAYVVVNDVKGKVISKLNSLGAAEFDAKFATTVASVTNVSDVASYATNKEIVVMTNQVKPEAITIKPNISESAAKTGPDNLIKVEVSRVAARGIVTKATTLSNEGKIKIEKDITKVDNTNGGTVTKEKKTTSTVTVTEISYQVTGSALQFNVLEDRTNWKVASDVYDYTPVVGTAGTAKPFNWSALNAGASGKFTYVDEGGFKVVEAIADNTVSNVQSALGKEQFSKFALPVTHAIYTKGNTTMFEVKAKFTVENNRTDFTNAEDLSSHTGDVFYGLTDGLFYSTKEKAEAMDASGATTGVKQQVAKYTNGEMYYYIWLNPDVLYSDTSKKISKSPIVRNQIYNAHITGFKELGLTGKEELNPDEVLETEKTYLSVQLKVLPWTIHSYKVDLGNRY